MRRKAAESQNRLSSIPALRGGEGCCKAARPPKGFGTGVRGVSVMRGRLQTGVVGPMKE